MTVGSLQGIQDQFIVATRMANGTNGYGGNVLQNFIDQMPTQGATMEIMPGDTDWATVPYDALQQFVDAGADRV